MEEFITKHGALVCPECRGSGEITVFCGCEVEETCIKCAGAGIVKSLNKQIHRKPCSICKGREGGCAGGCNYVGYHEWETYELFS